VVLKPRINAPDWTAGGNQEKAAKCIRFPPDRDSGYDPWFDPEFEQDCLDVCNGTWDGKVCPMRQECLEFSIINNEAFGVWGGLPPHDRKEIRKARRKDPYMEIKWFPPTPRLPELCEEDYLDPEELDDLDELLV